MSLMSVAGVLLVGGCGGTTVAGVVPAPPTPGMRTATVRTPSPTPTPTETRVFADGPPAVAYRAQEGAATFQVRRYSWQRTASGDEAAAPQNAYLVLDVVVTATEGKVQANPMYVSVRGADGTDRQPTLGSDGNEPVLASKEIKVGESVEGILTFDTPRMDTTINVVDEIGNPVVQIRIPGG